MESEPHLIELIVPISFTDIKTERFKLLN